MRGSKVFVRLLLLALWLVFPSAARAAWAYHFREIDAEFDGIARRLSRLDYENEREKASGRDLHLLDSIARKRGNGQLRARAMFWQVRMSQMSAQPPRCIELLEEAQRLSRGGVYDYDDASIAYQLAGNHERIGHYEECYTLLGEAIPVFEKYKDHFFLGNAYLLLVQMFLDIENGDEARKALRQSKEHYRKAGYPLGRIYFFEALLVEGGAEQRMLYEKALAVSGDRDWGLSLQAITSLSILFLEEHRADSAEHYCRLGFEMLRRNAPDNKLFWAVMASARAEVNLQQGRYEAALVDLGRLEAMSEQLRGERMMLDIYRMLWQVSDRQGHLAEAYRYLQLYQQESSRAGEQLRKHEVTKAQAREAIARQNDRILLLEKDAQLSRGYLYVAILACVVVLLAGIAVGVYFYQRMRIRRLQWRELRKSLEQEALIYKMNLKNFEDDIQQKDREISSSTLLLTNKNEVLKTISDITRRFSDEGRIPPEYVRQVNMAIGDSLHSDDEWGRFKLHFDSVHPDFFKRLKAASGELTENDLRLCAYLRIGMRAKQIAEMLSVSPDSINSNRYRLRKKLGLVRGESLDDYIRQI